MKAPMFVSGEFEKIQPAIDKGIIKYPAYIQVTDKRMFGYLDKNNKLIIVEGASYTDLNNQLTITTTTIDELKDVIGDINEVLPEGETIADYVEKTTVLDEKVNTIEENMGMITSIEMEENNG